MKCKSLKVFYLLLLACFFLSAGSLSALVCYEDEVDALLKEVFVELENENKTLLTQVDELENSLSESEKAQMIAKRQQQVSEEAQSEAIDLLQEAERSWRSESIALIFQGASLGVVVGVVACLILDVIFGDAFKLIPRSR